MAQSGPLSHPSFPYSGISILSPSLNGEAEILNGVSSVSKEDFQRFTQEHVHPQKVLQSDYFTSKLNSPHLCVAEKRELYVNNTAVPDTSLALFDRRTPPVEDKYSKTNPFINKLSARKHTSTEENPRGGDVALEKLWTELGITTDEQDAVRAHFGATRQNTGAYGQYIDTVRELSNYRRLYISIALLHERLTAEVVSALCNVVDSGPSSMGTSHLEGALALLGLYRLLVMALMALTEIVRDICTVPVCLPYLNIRDTRSINLVKQLLKLRLLSPERINVILSTIGQSVELVSVEEFFLRCEARHGTGIAEHLLLIACIPDSLIDVADASLVGALSCYFHLINNPPQTMADKLEDFFSSWMKRLNLNLSEISISVLKSLSGKFHPKHYVLMALEEEKLVTNFEMQLGEMQLRKPNTIFLTIPVCEDTSCSIVALQRSSPEPDAPNAPLLGHSSALRDSL